MPEKGPTSYQKSLLNHRQAIADWERDAHPVFTVPKIDWYQLKNPRNIIKAAAVGVAALGVKDYLSTVQFAEAHGANPPPPANFDTPIPTGDWLFQPGVIFDLSTCHIKGRVMEPRLWAVVKRFDGTEHSTYLGRYGAPNNQPDFDVDVKSVFEEHGINDGQGARVKVMAERAGAVSATEARDFVCVPETPTTVVTATTQASATPSATRERPSATPSVTASITRWATQTATTVRTATATARATITQTATEVRKTLTPTPTKATATPKPTGTPMPGKKLESAVAAFCAKVRVWVFNGTNPWKDAQNSQVFLDAEQRGPGDNRGGNGPFALRVETSKGDLGCDDLNLRSGPNPSDSIVAQGCKYDATQGTNFIEIVPGSPYAPEILCPVPASPSPIAPEVTPQGAVGLDEVPAVPENATSSGKNSDTTLWKIAFGVGASGLALRFVGNKRRQKKSNNS